MSKKIISMILAVVMTFSMFAVCASAEDAEADPTDFIPAASNGEVIPTIIMPGIGQSESTYVNEDGKEITGGLILIDDTDLVSKLISKLAMPLLSSIFMRKPVMNLGGAVCEAVSELFSIQASDKDR